MSTWNLYREGDALFAIDLTDFGLSLGYCRGNTRRRDGTSWDANVVKGIFYLLHIQIAKSYRGKGHGGTLYETVERIAKQLGCTEIRQHPSGRTPSGESRRAYCFRRDWLPDGMEVFKKL